MLALDTFCFMTRFVSRVARGAEPPIRHTGHDLAYVRGLPGRGSDPHGVGDAGNGRGTHGLGQHLTRRSTCHLGVLYRQSEAPVGPPPI